jgi:coenzyme F420-reducing hydrogenase delta subunit/Pyruvate/2-oxoacid:ferredoxin oxidoreductase delta subunit
MRHGEPPGPGFLYRSAVVSINNVESIVSPLAHKRRVARLPLIVAALQRVARGALRRADAALNRLYGWRYNPIYHSGVISTALLAILLVTGVYLLFLYRISSPYDSVARLTAQAWTGRWIRGVHRYASDAAVVAVFFHALRMFVQGRSWGPRVLAWVSGVVLLGVLWICGWTGYVMVWDVQAQVLAQAGARLLDVVPLFAQPISRAFVGDRALPAAFFFLNLFLHICLPIALGVLVWLHVSRVARPLLLPPRGLLWGGTGLLVALAVVVPVTMGPPADLLRLPRPAPYDAFYSFWLPLALAAPAWVSWVTSGAAAGLALLVPVFTRPPAARRPPPSFVDENLCTGCEQCYLDCPYEAIAMIDRPGGAGHRSALVARVNSARCVSCGICAGSCAPMGVGPPGRTGRDQLRTVERFVAERRPGARDVVIIACDRGAGGAARGPEFAGAPVYAASCAGSVHTSVVEYLVRAGAGGVLVVACPPRDCWNREGPKWLEQRMYHDREAELKERVDRRRIRLIYASAGEPELVTAALATLRADVAALDRARAEDDIDVVRACETDPVAALG